MEPPELHEAAKQVAARLGWSYDFQASTDREGALHQAATIRPGLTEYGVRMRVDWRVSTHFELAGDIPTRTTDSAYCYSYSGSTPKIRVAIARGLEAVARDLKARLLPKYEKVYQEAKAVVRRENERIAERNRIMKVLAPYGKPGRSRDTTMYLHRGGLVTINSVDLEMRINVSAEEAHRILQMLEPERESQHAQEVVTPRIRRRSTNR